MKKLLLLLLLTGCAPVVATPGPVTPAVFGAPPAAEDEAGDEAVYGEMPAIEPPEAE